jgi:four helix bundle protein
MKTHHDLDVWKKAIDLVTSMYKITNKYPKSEVYGLTNQIRRSAISIPSNIAEGAARKSPKEFAHFLSIAQGSATELETQLIISRNLEYINVDQFVELERCLSDIRKMLSGLIKSVNRNQ